MFELIALVAVIVVVVATIYGQLPGVKGTRGEAKVRELLAEHLDSDEYRPFHDLTLASSYGPTQIDHVVVSCYGIFVIETKNYTGWIFGDPSAKRWTQVIFRGKFSFQNPLRQNYKHVSAVQSFLGLDPKLIHSVVVFVGDAEFRTLLPPNVTNLSGLIPHIRSKVDRVLDPRRVIAILDKIASQESTTHPIARPNLTLVEAKPTCPKCGARMVARTARKGANAGTQFWGCSTYPNCNGTRNLQ